jgi:hypothetical protein
MYRQLAEMGEVLLKWGKLNFDKKKISANLNSKMHRLDKTVSPTFKNTIALDLNCQLELKSVLDAPIKKISFHFLHHGENTYGEEEPCEDASEEGVENRNGGPVEESKDSRQDKTDRCRAQER